MPKGNRQRGKQSLPALPDGGGALSASPRRKAADAKAQRRWLSGMIAGQIVFFALAVHEIPLLMVPSAAILPLLFAATLTGGVLGGFVQSRLTGRTTDAAQMPVRSYIFQALAETNRKLAEMFVEEEFNEAANSNSDSRRLKTKPELKVAPPSVAPPRF